MEFMEKRHCCCCVRISDGALLVGIYGASFHAGLLVVQCVYGHTMTASSPTDPVADDVINPVVLAIHSVGILVNVLLVFGSYFGRRTLLLPWLFSQGLLAMVLAALALHYLLLFPHSECYPDKEEAEDSLNNLFRGPEDCHVLLWHAVVMILSIMVLFYYFYVVHELAAAARHRSASKMGFEITVEEMVGRKEEPVKHLEEEEEGVVKKAEKRRVRIQEPAGRIV